MRTTPKFSRLAPEKRREQILDAANALFAERAYDEVSIENIASAAGVARGLVHRYFGGRKEVYITLVERSAPTVRTKFGRRWAAAPVRASRMTCRAGSTGPRRTAQSGSPPSDAARTSPTRTSSGVVVDLVRRAVALVAARHAEIAEDSPRLRYALECWTGLNRAATRRWLTGEATREATHELIASTLEHVLRTFGAPRATPLQTSLPETNRRVPCQPRRRRRSLTRQVTSASWPTPGPTCAGRRSHGRPSARAPACAEDSVRAWVRGRSPAAGAAPTLVEADG